MVNYAELVKVKIFEVTEYQRLRCMTVMGYTKKCGVPTDYKVQIKNSSVWYRVKILQFSNSGSLFVRTKNDPFLVVNDYELQDLLNEQKEN